MNYFLEYFLVSKLLPSMMHTLKICYLFQSNNFGCPAQAWSVSCVLDVLYDLEKLDTDVAIQPSKSTENLVVAPV